MPSYAMCNNSVEKTEKNSFLRCQMVANVAEKIENIDVAEKWKSGEKQMNDFIEKKLAQLQREHSKEEKTYAGLASVDNDIVKLIAEIALTL